MNDTATSTARLEEFIAQTPDGADAPLRHAAELVASEAEQAQIERGLAAARVLRELRVDQVAQAAALMLALPDADAATAAKWQEAVGDEVAAMREGVARLQRIRWDSLEDEAAESLRKMFLAMASDLRVVLIALGVRVHEMRTLRDASEAERRAVAKETMEIYAPLANRLGIWQLKWELEDLGFKYLEPELYREIRQLLSEKRDARTTAIATVIETLQGKLADADIEASVVGRPKHIYSIYKKMRRKGVGFEQIYDVSAVRVIVDELATCYAVLGLVHAAWTPIDGEFDDYIAKPKENFYRSLHTAVFGPEGGPLEVQIRTQEMHEYNEFGIAAHWRYKEAKKADRRFDDKINWVRQLMAWQKGVTDPRDVAHSLKTDIFADQVYVFTPGGEVVDLPVGATPIDFAYRIHTQVGHRCRGAKVGGQIVPLDYALRNGDRVEIITAKSGTPSRDWLNPHVGLVKTASARQKIRQFFRQQQRDESIVSGRDLVERELKRMGLDARKLDDVLAPYIDAGPYRTNDDVLAALGFGDITPQSIASRLLELAPRPEPAAGLASPKAATKPSRPSVSVAGIDDVLSRTARCCGPVPGDDVMGFITRGKGIVIHRSDCANFVNHHEPERWMPLSWGSRGDETYPVDVVITANDRKGLLRDIADTVAQESINMTATAARSGADPDEAIIESTLAIRSSDQLGRVLTRLERLRGVISARRTPK